MENLVDVGKKAKKPKKNPQHKNPRAFNVANIVRTKRTQQRNLDREQKKEVVPLNDRAEDVPPPVLVVVMGPAGVGKSTLIRSLVKMYTGQNLTTTSGPITVVAGKKRRITFFECPLDLYSMTDLSKVADLVLLMIDASYGFEMDTFEFLNQLQLHGFPKVVGVLSNLDKFRANKTLQAAKKVLKHRFWTEIYKGAKVFEFMGVVNGKYLKHEVKRLALHVSRVKFRPLVWRNTHPYLVVDRVEDITPVISAGHSSRDVALFGYVRGTHLKESSLVHLIGVGDFPISSISLLPDPCPIQQSETGLKRSTLKLNKQSLLYAPMANIGRVTVDGDGLYIDIKNIYYTKKEHLQIGEGAVLDRETFGSDTPAGMLRSMQDVSNGFDKQLATSNDLALFADGAAFQNDENSDDGEDEDDVDGEDEDDVDGEDEDEDEDEDSDEDGSESRNGEEIVTDVDDESSSASLSKDESVDNYNNFNQDLNAENARNSAMLKNSFQSLSALVYRDFHNSHVDEDKSHNLGFSSKDRKQYELNNIIDSSRIHGRSIKETSSLGVRLSSNMEVKSYETGFNRLLKNRFVTGDEGWLKSDSTKNPDTVEIDGGLDVADVDDAFGDFEDLTVPTKVGHVDTAEPNHLEENAMEKNNEEIDEQLRQLNASRKANFKAKFDTSYDETKDESKDDENDPEEDNEYLEKARKLQNDIKARNREEFGQDGEAMRIQLEGFRQGLYVRMVLREVSSAFLENFKNEVPVIVGGLLPHEMKLGYTSARVKRHRWHKRILKSNDPVIFSIGWRRFQSIPVYSTVDQNDRERFIKYTPEHMHCTATFYGPLVPPNTGILGFQKADRSVAGFRISITGVALEQKATPNVVKKLKLVGYPKKVYKNTAFVSGMFNSALEVAKFENVQIKTVSGIRGQIKKAVRENFKVGDNHSKFDAGTFRASFEDKILMSDIILCRMWVPVAIPQFYNPVLSLLDDYISKPKAIEGGNPAPKLLMRTTAEIRREEKIAQEVNKDSLYTPIVRVPREFRKLHLPSKLQASLPFASKPKQEKPLNRQSYAARRAVVLEPEERKSRAALQMLSTLKASKTAIRLQSNNTRLKLKQKKREQEQAKFTDVHKEEKKRKYRADGITMERKAKATESTPDQRPHKKRKTKK